MRKYVTELNNDELLKVLHANEKLQNEVFEDMIEHEMYWIGEQLDCFSQSLSNWSVGMDSHVYLNVQSGDEQSFVDGVMDMQKKYGVLPDSENEFISAIESKIEEYRNMEFYHEYEELESEIEELAQQLADKIAAKFQKALNGVYDKKYQEEYFISFYALERLDKSCYIETDDDDFVLYEDVSYTKKYS